MNTTLNHRISIFVPSTVDGNKPAKRLAKKEAKRAAKYLCTYFGGATQQAAQGYWISDTKGLIKEEQTVIFAQCTEADREAHTAKVMAYAKRLARRMRQEAVTVVVDSEMYFIQG